MYVPFVALLISLLALPRGVQAQIDYGIQIAGVKVTSGNYKQIDASHGFTAIEQGKVTYDPGTKTLTLDNSEIMMEKGDNCIFNGKNDGLVIRLIGTCKLKSSQSYSSPLNIWKKTTIMGSGILQLINTGGKGNAINLDKKTTLTIKDCTVEATGPGNAILSRDATESSLRHLVIDNATVTAQGGKGCIVRLASLTLNGCDYVFPEGARFKEERKAVCNASGTVITGKVVIAPSEGDETYDVVLEQIGTSKIKVIKAVKGLTGLGLKETKELVESAPCVVLSNLSKSKAENAAELIRAAGATVIVVPHGSWEPTAIEAAVADVTATVVAIYSIDGRRISQLQEGLNIVLYSDGSIRKVTKY